MLLNGLFLFHVAMSNLDDGGEVHDSIVLKKSADNPMKRSWGGRCSASEWGIPCAAKPNKGANCESVDRIDAGPVFATGSGC